MFDNKSELMENIDEMGIYLDWIGVLLRDINEDYLQPLAHDCKGKDYGATQLVRYAGEQMEAKGDMVERFLCEISKRYRAITRLVFNQEQIKDRRDMTRAERIDEILNDVNAAVSIIENRPDWLDSMKELNGKAWALAMEKGKTADTQSS